MFTQASAGRSATVTLCGPSGRKRSASDCMVTRTRASVVGMDIPSSSPRAGRTSSRGGAPEAFSLRHVPHQQRAVAAGGDEAFAVGREFQAGRVAAQAGEPLQLAAGGDVPGGDRWIL